MLASRNLYLQNCTESVVGVGPWYKTEAMKAKGFADAFFPEEGVDLKAKDEYGKALWTKKAGWEDGKIHELRGGNSFSTYLYRVINSDKAVTVTVSLGSNDGIEVWLNGKKLLSYNKGRPVVPDSHLVDLQLKAGDNEFLMKVHNISSFCGFYFSISQNSAALQLWRAIKKKYPTKCGWMANELGGNEYLKWFYGPNGVEAEKIMIESVLEDLGVDGAKFKKEYDLLIKQNVSSESRRWLDLYTKSCLHREDFEVFKEVRGILQKMPGSKKLLSQLSRYERQLDEMRQRLPLESPEIAKLNAKFQKFVRGVYLSQLDRPLLFIKRYSYSGIHIYDTFYKWPAKDKGNGDGIGGIYILENPSSPRDQWKIKTVIDGRSKGTLGNGVYSHPDVSYDCSKIIFCYKATPTGSTMIYEIDIDGSNLVKLTDPTPCLAEYKGVKDGIHDLSPTYLPDGRIVFLSTRPAGLVPCANEGVSILHVMNADGSDIHPISVNPETEFDPMVLPDGRIIYGRWEYIDKTALTVQSLWTVYPDGSNETALYGNNMVFPEAILDPRAVPGTGLIVATLTKHNAPPRGAIAMIDLFAGKNDPAAIFNFENKSNPTHDRGNSCEPYPLSKDVVIYSGRPNGARRNAIMMMNRKGQRITLLSDPKISLHAPMLVKPRSARILPQFTDRSKTTGKFYIQNVYDGLKGVKPGEAKWLRVIEESSRVSASPGSSIFNQTFSISAALAFSAKIYHGMVPIYQDGSAYFEVPSGRAIFFQVLDKDKRLIQSMRTFIQATPGITRSCIGCHENKTITPTSLKPISNTMALRRPPSAPKPESWGSGYMDYSTLIQPIWDKNCISCHGGEKKFAGRLDLTGGWTQFFNNSYENLVDRRHSQLVPYYIAGIDCMNGTAHYSVPLFPPKSFGSAVAPLAKVIASGHKGRIKNLTDVERDLIMAWIDSNGLYFGTWDYTSSGPRLTAWTETRKKLTQTMSKAKCYSCHDKHFGGDWFNLQKPEFSRILRAPLAKGKKGLGLAICQNHRTDSARNRINLLRGGYQHAVRNLSFYAEKPLPALKEGGTAKPTFASSDEPLWQEMLTIIRDGRTAALQQPRVDMPGAELIAGKSRMMVAPAVPDRAPELEAYADEEGVVTLQWKRTARIIGLSYEIHRSPKKNFTPNETTLIAKTMLSEISDKTAPAGRQYYGLVLVGENGRSSLSRTQVQVKAASPITLEETKSVSLAKTAR